MHLLILILKKVEYVDELIVKLAEAGLHGGTIVDATGMASVLENYEDFPMFGILRRALSEDTERESAKMMLFVVTEDEMKTAKEVIRQTVGGLSKPNTGIMFSIPVDYVEGLGE